MEIEKQFKKQVVCQFVKEFPKSKSNITCGRKLQKNTQKKHKKIESKELKKSNLACGILTQM